MSPRPAPTRTDATADSFLRAGLRLMDALLGAYDLESLPPRLRSLHFPAPLEWIRIEDVIREARQEEGTLSAKAFWNRWPDKDTYLVDLTGVAFAEVAAPESLGMRARLTLTVGNSAEGVRRLAMSVMAELLARPRSYLLGHLASVSQGSTALQDAIRASIEEDNRSWSAFFEAGVAEMGMTWRPGWDGNRMQIAIQALVDGMLIRGRVVRPEGGAGGSPWDPVELLGEAVVSLFASAVDLDADGRSPAQLVDDALARRLLSAE